MESIPLTALTKKTGEVVDAAQRAPILLTRHKRKAFVLMSWERYELLVAEKPPRGGAPAEGRGVSAHFTNDLPADLEAELDAAIEATFASGPDEPAR